MTQTLNTRSVPLINVQLMHEQSRHFKQHRINMLFLTTRNIVIIIEKYLHDYKNSHIFVGKD
jgi:hypothetical protein